MRIAMVGAPRSAHALTRSAAVAEKGHEVRFVTVGPVLPVGGIEVRTRPLPGNLIEAVAAARGFFDDIRSFAPDVLHLHYAGGKLGTLALLAGVRPFVVTVMGGDVIGEQHLGGWSPLEQRATRRILDEADLILAKSQSLRRAVAALGDFDSKVEVTYWGVDPARFRRDVAGAEALRKRLGLGPRDRVILSPRHLQPLYNIRLLVDAMPRVRAAQPEAALLLAEYNADAEYRQALETRVRELGLVGRVRFLGPVDPETMPALYSLADLAVSVPIADGLPQSLFEAMACETPVVLGRLAAYGEVVADGETAVFADLTVEGVADAVIRMLRDRDVARGLAVRALARVKEVASLPREVERIDRFYRGLRSRVRPRPRRPVGRLLDALSLLVR